MRTTLRERSLNFIQSAAYGLTVSVLMIGSYACLRWLVTGEIPGWLLDVAFGVFIGCSATYYEYGGHSKKTPPTVDS